MPDTSEQYDKVIDLCKDVFEKKMTDYGTAWRILRPESLTDQILIKAQRIRSIETKQVSKINEGVIPEYIGIINYAIIALIQIELGIDDNVYLDRVFAVEKYTHYFNRAKNLMNDKNHDYDEAWRVMRISSFTDLILMKLYRTKEIENNKGQTLISENVDANYFDMVNYAVFALIRLVVEES